MSEKLPKPLSEKDLASIGAGMDEKREEDTGWIKVPFNPEEPDGPKVTLNITGEGRSKGAEAEPTVDKMIERLR